MRGNVTYGPIIKKNNNKESTMSIDINNSVLLSTFQCGRKKFRLYFHRGQIVWDNERPPYAQRTLPLTNVIAVDFNQITDDGSANRPNGVRYDPHKFTIHYAEPGENSTWKYSNICLRHRDPLQVASWVKTLQHQLQLFTSRPKRLLLFINPHGGKKRALQVFEKYGKALFAIAGVDVSVVISQRPNQIRDITIHHNLDIFDSIACVGGDGTFSELFNGLVIRECRNKGVDPDDISQELPRPSLPIGVIPGGSTDTIAYCLHGTTDVTTAVLQIIFGDCRGLDLVSVYDDTRMLRLYASVLSYGYLGDVAYFSEAYRWMGPKRYEYTGFKKVITNKGYLGEITFLPNNNNDGDSHTKCVGDCERCKSNLEETIHEKGDAANSSNNEKKIVRGKFFMISGANISCACERSPSGIAPCSHLGDGTVHLVLVKHTSLLNVLRLLSRLTKNDYTTEDLSFVEIHQTKEFSFRAIDVQSRWNCDGEVQHQTDINAKVRRQLVSVFSRGSMPKTEPSKWCCGLNNLVFSS